MTTTKNCFFLVIIKHYYLVGGIDFWWGGNKNLLGAHFPGGGGMNEFLAGGGTSPIPLSRENPVLCEKNSEWEEESIILIPALFLSSFLSVKFFLKIGN